MQINKFSVSLLSTATIALLLTGLNASAHTRLEIPVVKEGTRVSNNVSINHACGQDPVIGTSVVFPARDGSTILVDDQPYGGVLTDFVQNWGNSIKGIYSRAAFDFMVGKQDSLGNVVGFWAGGGAGMAADMVAYVPFRMNAINIEPTSCAERVVFNFAIVDICHITGPEGFSDSGNVGLWTENHIGSLYDSHADGMPATLTVQRDLAANPLPASCGQGVKVTVIPSAAHVDRYMPIVLDGQQIWPAAGF